MNYKKLTHKEKMDLGWVLNLFNQDEIDLCIWTHPESKMVIISDFLNREFTCREEQQKDLIEDMIELNKPKKK